MKKCTIAIFTLLLLASIGCHNEWLEVKRSKNLVTPSSLEDLQALLDYTKTMNEESTPAFGAISADNYFITEAGWASLSSQAEKNAYIWAKEIFEESAGDSEWNRPYKQIFTCNLALELLKKMDRTANPDLWRNIKGSALFYRSHAFYQLAQLYCNPFSETAGIDPGIPLRLESDVNLPSKRASVKETYERILKDLRQSVELLPVEPLVKTRPSQPAAYALLARTYLQMEDYDRALAYADSCLNMYAPLLDYNTVDTSLDYPFDRFNEEVIFQCSMGFKSIISSSRMHVDTVLYNSYLKHDLRKSAFFEIDDGRIRFKGSYDGSLYYFSGIATDEMLLTRAECYIRTDEIEKGLADLNALLQKRYVTGTFEPVAISDRTEALEIILSERRKELIFRGIRYFDLRRLNKDERFAKTLTRNINGEIYTLSPNDSRYVLPIPNEVIALSGISQNAR